jgi:hypothetical protein
VSTGLTIGNTYYVSVDNHNGSSGYRGTFTLCLQDVVSYDYYEGAVLLNDLNNYCSADAAYILPLKQLMIKIQGHVGIQLVEVIVGLNL